MDREWTDKRMDDFAKSVDKRFDQVDARFERVDRRFDKVDERFDRIEAEMKTGFARVAVESKAASEKLDSRLDHMNIAVWVGIVGVAASRILFG